MVRRRCEDGTGHCSGEQANGTATKDPIYQLYFESRATAKSFRISNKKAKYWLIG
jgi:hypothetical protein